MYKFNNYISFNLDFSIFICLSQMNIFKIPLFYHIIKGQTFIKIYVLYNFLEVLDKLMCSLGYDVMDYAKQMLTSFRYGKYIDRFLNIHAVIMLLQLISLNVAVNAHNHLLLSLFISNQVCLFSIL
ncbi:hypothetical protein HZS_6670 [Henneguya salminicola]|nr:hypothetical protein HZS_6670 [Henneguya salminicola]